MDGSNSSFDPNIYGSDYTRPTRTSLSDDGIMLASTTPKKRAGRTKFKETRHPIYRGVRMRNVNKWVCEVREPNKKTRIWLGTYPSAEMAARAHDVAALALRGNMACLNFADSTWRLPVPVTNDAKDIRKAATEAAEAFRPKDIEEVDDGDNMRDINDDDKSFDGIEDRNSDGTTDDGEETTVSVQMDSYMDEEIVFYMPRLISDMAQGMLLSPPRCLAEWSLDDVESPDDDVSLWNFSI